MENYIGKLSAYLFRITNNETLIPCVDLENTIE